MDIAILTLAICIIMLLVAIFAVLIVKNKGNKSNLDKILQDINDRQKDEIVENVAQNCKSANQTMLDELSRSNNGLSSNLTATIAASNSTLSTTIAANNDTLNKTMNDFRDAQEKKFLSLETRLAEKLENIHTEMNNALNKQKVDNVNSNAEIRETMSKKLSDIDKEMSKQLGEIKQESIKNISNINQMLTDRLADIDKEIAKELEKLRTENQKKLDEMRDVVDSKMQDTLNKRLNESFEVISKQLLEVSKGLGEMSNLSNGVNNLNKIMSNVKTRGIWGEIALKNLLDQILTTDQYGEQVQIKGREMVDFAVILPGKKDEEKIYLPIDAKFPLEDYQLLVEASDNFDKDKVEIARKNLFKRIKEEAKSISTKYIDVPRTTNFAIMYLPIEGLFAEVARDSVLLDELQSKLHIIVSGPTTITALLNSLQLGFKTLHIQKSSKEVWNALGKFKTQFQKFSESLSKVKKHAENVVSTIEETNKKTQKIESVLNKIGTIEFDQTEVQLIGGGLDESNADD